MISSKDIAVVVQGAIDEKETAKCLKSIRRYLPDAEIILSTWEGSSIGNLEFDILKLNKDPGAELLETTRNRTIYNNMNRQLLSTQEGLKLATRKFALKLRSDLILSSNKFLMYFNEFTCRTENYKLFERKIITPTLFTRFNFHNRQRKTRLLMPFHISDWWLLGLKKDLDTYFADTQLVKEPGFTNYFSLPENKQKNSPYGDSCCFKFAPEQYFGYECFSRNYKDIHMEDASDYSDKTMSQFRECLVNNFIVLEYAQSGIYLNKYPYSKNERFSGDQYIGLYNFYRYETEYKNICDNGYQIQTHNTKMFKDEEYGYDLLRIYKHISKFAEPKTSLLSKLEQILISIPFSILSFLVKHFKNFK
jgi:hypothetical protein